MAFPTTSVLDNFNTTTGDNLRGRTGWHATNIWISTEMNQWRTDLIGPTYAAGNPSPCSAYWGTTVGPDSETYIDFSGVFVNTVVLFVRTGFTAGVASSGYLARLDNAGAFSIEKWDATVLASGSFTSPASGDTYGFEAAGSALTVYRKPSGGSWGTDLGGGTLTVSDSTYTGSGLIGMASTSGSGVRIDSFSGGSSAASATPQMNTHRVARIGSRS